MPVTSKYGRTPSNKHGGMGRQQQYELNVVNYMLKMTDCVIFVINIKNKNETIYMSPNTIVIRT